MCIRDRSVTVSLSTWMVPGTLVGNQFSHGTPIGTDRSLMIELIRRVPVQTTQSSGSTTSTFVPAVPAISLPSTIVPVPSPTVIPVSPVGPSTLTVPSNENGFHIDISPSESSSRTNGLKSATQKRQAGRISSRRSYR